MAAKARTRRRTQKKTQKKRDWRPDFLKAFADEGMVMQACEVAKVSRSTVYEERQKNEAFAIAWADIEECTTQEMEREAYRRGVEGVEEPVYQGKELVGHVRKFSDTLLIFMLKSRKPEIYRDLHTVRHEGKVSHAHSLDLSKLSASQLEELEQLVAAAT